MNAANQRQLTPILAAIAVLLGAVLLMLLLGIGATAHWNPPRAPAPLPPAGKSDALPKPVPLQQFAVVWQKPLFNPERKPVARAADGGSSLGDLDLTGIILTPSLRMALLHDRNGDKQVRLREGESLPDGSVTLVEVHPRSALFDSSAGRSELRLPAGAPIDASRPEGPHADELPSPGADEPEADEARRPPVLSGSEIIAPPTVTPQQRARPEHARESAVERLRKNIQKRRAERAAAARKGDH
jgi:general secretion pathway protein N